MWTAGKGFLFDQTHRIPTAHGRGRGIAGGRLTEGAQYAVRVLLIPPNRLVNQHVGAGAVVGLLFAANFGGVGRVVVPAHFVLAIKVGVVIKDRFQRHDRARGAFGGHGERFGGTAVVLRVDLKQRRLQGQFRANGVTQFAAPVPGRVVGPAAAVGHGQRVCAKAGVHKAGQQGHAAEVIAHRQEADLGIQCG